MKFRLSSAKRDQILGPLGARQARVDRAQVELERRGELGVGRGVGAEEPLLLGIALDPLAHRRPAAGPLEIAHRLGVDREEAHRGPVFGRHVGDGGPVGQRQRAEPGAGLHELVSVEVKVSVDLSPFTPLTRSTDASPVPTPLPVRTTACSSVGPGGHRAFSPPGASGSPRLRCLRRGDERASHPRSRPVPATSFPDGSHWSAPTGSVCSEATTTAPASTPRAPARHLSLPALPRFVTHDTSRAPLRAHSATLAGGCPGFRGHRHAVRDRSTLREGFRDRAIGALIVAVWYFILDTPGPAVPHAQRPRQGSLPDHPAPGRPSIMPHVVIGSPSSTS